MEKHIVHDASQKAPRKTCDGFPPHCQHTALLQGVCLHDPRTSGAIIGKFSTRSTTRFSFRPTNGRTCSDNTSQFGQEQSSWTPIVDHQLGFIQSLRYSSVGHTMGSFAATKYIRPIDLDFTMPLSRSNRCRSRWCWC